MQGVKLISTFVEEIRKQVFGSNKDFPTRTTYTYVNKTTQYNAYAKEDNKSIHKDMANRTPTTRRIREGGR